MKIQIVPTEKPFCSSFQMCAQIDLNKLKEKKEVTIEVSNATKTRLSTAFKFENAKYNINYFIEGYNLHEDRQHSYISGGVEVSNYFKLSKKQDKEMYKEYLKALLTNLFKNTFELELDTLKVKLIDYTK
jgi:hypothetical protein